MPELNPGGVSTRDPDRLIMWFIGVVVIGVGVNLLSGFVVAQNWNWLPPAVFVAALLVAVPSTGLLRRERYNTTRARGMALLALTGYLAVVVWGSVTGWPLAVMILSVAYLWEAGVMLTWPTLRNRADVDRVAVGTACLLVGSAFLLLGVANPLDASTPGTIASLLVRVALLLFGVAALLLGVAVLLDTWTLVRVPFLLFGLAALLAGVAAFLAGWTLVGVALLLGPLTALLLGVAFLLDKWTLLGIPFLLGAVAAPLGGVAALLAGLTLVGVTALLLGVAFLLGGVASFLNGWTLLGVPFLLFGAAGLLGGVAAFLDGWTLVGVAFLLLGIAAPLSGVALLYRPDLPRGLVAWLISHRGKDASRTWHQEQDSAEETIMTQANTAATTHSLTKLPEGSTLRAVTAVPAEVAGRRALRVELTDAVTLEGRPGVDYVDMPTFMIVPASFTNGTIEVDILSRLNGKGPADARAFAGIAYRVTADGDRFEAVYLRPLNGQKANPPRPRDQRAIQYFAYPDWKFDRLREQYPDGDYEAGADIGPDEWITLKLDIDDTRLTATVNGTESLALSETKATPVAGAVGLFVDIGSESFFSHLKITPR